MEAITENQRGINRHRIKSVLRPTWPDTEVNLDGLVSQVESQCFQKAKGGNDYEQRIVKKLAKKCKDDLDTTSKSFLEHIKVFKLKFSPTQQVTDERIAQRLKQLFEVLSVFDSVMNGTRLLTSYEEVNKVVKGLNDIKTLVERVKARRARESTSNPPPPTSNPLPVAINPPLVPTNPTTNSSLSTNSVLSISANSSSSLQTSLPPQPNLVTVSSAVGSAAPLSVVTAPTAALKDPSFVASMATTVVNISNNVPLASDLATTNKRDSSSFGEDVDQTESANKLQKVSQSARDNEEKKQHISTQQFASREVLRQALHHMTNNPTEELPLETQTILKGMLETRNESSFVEQKACVGLCARLKLFPDFNLQQQATACNEVLKHESLAKSGSLHEGHGHLARLNSAFSDSYYNISLVTACSNVAETNSNSLTTAYLRVDAILNVHTVVMIDTASTDSYPRSIKVFTLEEYIRLNQVVEKIGKKGTSSLPSCSNNHDLSNRRVLEWPMVDSNEQKCRDIQTACLQQPFLWSQESARSEPNGISDISSHGLHKTIDILKLVFRLSLLLRSPSLDALRTHDVVQVAAMLTK